MGTLAQACEEADRSCGTHFERRRGVILEACKESGIALLEITLEHAATAAALPRGHRDPFDRMLIAQAIVERLTTVTDDAAFRRYKRLRVFGALKGK
jgi:PIN domain nuclease of toxin-antitoxin system